MKKIPFNLESWLADKSQKVVTSDGHSARIICTDAKSIGENPDRILALISADSGFENALFYTRDGWCLSDSSQHRKKDLFLVTPDPELTEFERAVFDCIDETVVSYIDDYTPDTRVDLIQAQFEKWSPKLLAIASKQIEAERIAVVGNTIDEDERARMWLYDYIFNCPNENFAFYGGVGKQAVLAWLEKQKDNKFAPRVLPCSAAWFEDGEERQKEQKPKNILTNDDSLQTAYLKGQTDVLEDPEAYGLQKEQKPVEFNLWKDTKKELPKPDSLILVQDFDVIRSFYYEGDGYLDKADGIKLSIYQKWCYQSDVKEIKPVEWSKATINGEPIPTENQSVDIPLAEWSEVELEFRGEKVKVKRPFFRDDKGRGYSTTEQDEDVAWNALRAWCEKKGISLYDLYPKAEWSEEDEKIQEGIMQFLFAWRSDAKITKWLDWLKSLQKRFSYQTK